MELLRQETDEEHPMRTSEICKCITDMGITCDRRTLSRDISMLNEYGYEVMSTMIGHNKAYYVEDRGFSLPELKILMDAVHASAFITEKKSAELIDKIANLGGNHKAELLKRNLVCFNTRKHRNESIYYNVGFLEDALQKHQKVSFYYFDLDENGERIYRKKKKLYQVEPMALVFNEDNYYLMCFSSKYDGICNYRVDRMEQVSILDEPVSADAIITSESLSSYTEQVFKMYGGPTENAVLQFDKSLIGVVHDKFGEDTKMICLDKNNCVATVQIQISPTFWGWIFQFTDKMQILSPQSLVEDYKRQCKKICGQTE